MPNLTCDIAVIGGGPAGLAAAVEAKRLGAKDVLVIERDFHAGGILPQCIHDGFGLHRFGQQMSGGQYAQHFIDEAAEIGVDLLLNTMVLEITQDKLIYAVNETDGMLVIQARAIILAMGCRERTRPQVFIMGTRPSGVLTAGAVQRYINIEGYLPGKKAVILGSGDIGLIMARRMTLEGMEVEGVYEIMPTLGGLRRNAVQCLEDYDIPLHLATTVAQIFGEQRLEGVMVQEVDEHRKLIPGTERYIECDLLVLAVGLIPENELSIDAGVEIDPVTKDPMLDESMMTSVPGIFACGNVAAVFDLVDYVSETGEAAARGAVKYINGGLDTCSDYIPVQHDQSIGVLIPQRVRGANLDGPLAFYCRVTHPMRKCEMRCVDGEEVQVYRKRHQVALPPEMLCANVDVPEMTTALNFTVQEV